MAHADNCRFYAGARGQHHAHHQCAEFSRCVAGLVSTQVADGSSRHLAAREVWQGNFMQPVAAIRLLLVPAPARFGQLQILDAFMQQTSVHIRQPLRASPSRWPPVRQERRAVLCSAAVLLSSAASPHPSPPGATPRSQALREAAHVGQLPAADGQRAAGGPRPGAGGGGGRSPRGSAGWPGRRSAPRWAPRAFSGAAQGLQAQRAGRGSAWVCAPGSAPALDLPALLHTLL